MSSQSGIVTVIPCLGKSGATRRCLESLLAQTDVQNKVIVVENGTTENMENLSAAFPSVLFLRNGRNEGFT